MGDTTTRRTEGDNDTLDTPSMSPSPPSSSPSSRRNRAQGTCGSPFKPKQRVRCVFCRGSSCNRCGSTAYLQLDSPALDKVHSSWITESIVAMQRPSDMLIENANLLEQFTSLGIGTIVNLTEPGEHPYCGPGLVEASGFPYSPEKFMARGINHFNYSWPDMTTPSLAVMEDIVQVAGHQLTEGRKIAVHCHAGYGRTGLAIACILMAHLALPPDEAISIVRKQRPGSLQTSKQVAFVNEFSAARRDAVAEFPTKAPDPSTQSVPPTESRKVNTASASATGASRTVGAKTFARSLRDQQLLLSTSELSSRRLRWTGKLILKVTDTFFAAYFPVPISIRSEGSPGHRTPLSQSDPLGLGLVENVTLEASSGIMLADQTFLAACISGWTHTPSLVQPQPLAIASDRDTIAAMEKMRCDLSSGLWSSLDESILRGKAAVRTDGTETATGAGEGDVFVCCQLLLQWLESRVDSVLDADCLRALLVVLCGAGSPGEGHCDEERIEASTGSNEVTPSQSPSPAIATATATAAEPSPVALSLVAIVQQQLCRIRFTHFVLLSNLLGALASGTGGAEAGAIGLAALRLAVSCLPHEKRSWALASPIPAQATLGSCLVLNWPSVSACLPVLAAGESLIAASGLDKAKATAAVVTGAATLSPAQQELCLTAWTLRLVGSC